MSESEAMTWKCPACGRLGTEGHGSGCSRSEYPFDELRPTCDDTPEYLANVVIDMVKREPVEPSGRGMHAIIADLFRQFAQKAVGVERKRCSQIARAAQDKIESFPDGTLNLNEFAPEGWAAGVAWLIAGRIESGEQPKPRAGG